MIILCKRFYQLISFNMILLLESFSHQRKLMVFHWSLSDSRSPQVSRNLLSILADLNNAVVWRVSTRPVIYKFSSSCTNPLETVSRTPITIGIIVNFMFFRFSRKVDVPIILFVFFQFYSAVSWDSKVHNSASTLFFVDYYKVWSTCRYEVICLYLKTSEKFVCLIL